MSTTLPQSLQPAVPSNEVPSCQAIAFQVAEHWLALPHAALLQVVHRTALSQDIRSELCVYLGKQPVAVLNLEPLLAATRSEQPPYPEAAVQTQSEAQFLVVAALEKSIVGIPVQQLPVLLELPLAGIHPLPSNYYQAIQGIASHVVSVPQFGRVLLLNLYTLTGSQSSHTEAA